MSVASGGCAGLYVKCAGENVKNGFRTRLEARTGVLLRKALPVSRGDRRESGSWIWPGDEKVKPSGWEGHDLKSPSITARTANRSQTFGKERPWDVCR